MMGMESMCLRVFTGMDTWESRFVRHSIRYLIHDKDKNHTLFVAIVFIPHSDTELRAAITPGKHICVLSCV